MAYSLFFLSGPAVQTLRNILAVCHQHIFFRRHKRRDSKTVILLMILHFFLSHFKFLNSRSLDLTRDSFPHLDPCAEAEIRKNNLTTD